MANEPGSQGGGPADDIQRQFNDAMGKLTGPGEPLIALGAILFVFVDIFGDLIFEKWGVGYFELVPAWFVLGAIFLNRFRGQTLPIAYPLLLATLGFIAGFVEVRDILGSLRDEVFDRDGSQIIFELISWAAGILMLFGAIQLWPSAKNG